ncbi:hypothetical protein J2P12_06140 [Candidatus Bathyarchaeota archaeon]|nr:hypothetical protein [Candidatus Bathyarchaeota archaeon]
MSWIVRDLWTTLECRRDEYGFLLEMDKIRAYEVVNRISDEVGQRHGVILMLSFPPGQYPPKLKGLGHRDLSLLVQRGKEKFGPVSQLEVKRTFEKLKPLRFETLIPNQEGFKAWLSNGVIDCLPGGIHIWCEITPSLLEVLDWLFMNAYGLQQG